MDNLNQGEESVEGAALTQEELDLKPWKYIGYKGFARYVSLSEDFFALRRYDRLHCRVLLTLQDHVAHLEEELDLLDDRLSSRAAADVDNGTLRKDGKERKDLVLRIAGELKNYDEMLNHYLALNARPRANARIAKNVKTWLSNNNSPIEPKETEFLNAMDLISGSPSSKSALRYMFEQRILAPTKGLFGILNEKGRPGDLGDPFTTYGRDEPVNIIASVAVFIMAFTMLVAPLWILAVVDDMYQRLGIITSFITVFLSILTSATLAKPFEILAATAGYAAVLVVFLQIGSMGSSSGV